MVENGWVSEILSCRDETFHHRFVDLFLFGGFAVNWKSL